MVLQAQRLSVEEFLAIAQLPENAHKRLELIDGVILEMGSSSPDNTIIASLIAHFLWVFVLAHRLGYVSGADGGYKITPNTLLIPDVAFIAKERWQKGKTSVFTVTPDLAVEVISPSETQREIHNKITAYLQAGTRLVWTVYPDDKVVEVWRMGSEGIVSNTLGMDGVLDGGDILVGFELPVKDIFIDMDSA